MPLSLVADPRLSDLVVPRLPRSWVCAPDEITCINGHPYDDRRVRGSRHSIHFVGFGHSYYRCRCGACAFGLHTSAPVIGATVTLYACSKEDLLYIEREMLYANTLEILKRLGYTP